MKQLGVYIDENSTFDEHIFHLWMKATSLLNSLQSIAKYQGQITKNVVSGCFNLSNFCYCPLLWHICSSKNTQKVEKMQHYKTLLETSVRELMYISRLKSLPVLSLNVWTIPVLVQQFTSLTGKILDMIHEIAAVSNNHYVPLPAVG